MRKPFNLHDVTEKDDLMAELLVVNNGLNLQATFSNTGAAVQYTVAGLPAGLSIDPSTGTLIGIPTQSKSGVMTVTATSGSTVLSSISVQYSITSTAVAVPIVVDLELESVNKCKTEYQALSTSDSASGDRLQKFKLFSRLTEHAVRSDTPAAYDVIWNLHIQYVSSDLTEEFFFAEDRTDNTKEDDMVMAVYTAFRSLVAYPSRPFDLSVVYAMTKSFVLLTYLQSKMTSIQ